MDERQPKPQLAGDDVEAEDDDRYDGVSNGRPAIPATRTLDQGASPRMERADSRVQL
jgi:hypothetical protein